MRYYMTINELKIRLRALLFADIMLTPPEDDHLRLVNAGSEGELQWAIIDNGGGDRMWVYIKGESAVIKGFDHESELNQFAAEEWDSGFFDRVFEGMPAELYSLFTEEERDETTFCLWTTDGGNSWVEHPQSRDNGKTWLMGYLFDSPEELCRRAQEHYEAELPLCFAKTLYTGGTPTAEEILSVAPDRDAAQVLEEFAKAE